MPRILKLIPKLRKLKIDLILITDDDVCLTGKSYCSAFRGDNIKSALANMKATIGKDRWDRILKS